MSCLHLVSLVLSKYLIIKCLVKERALVCFIRVAHKNSDTITRDDPISDNDLEMHVKLSCIISSPSKTIHRMPNCF